MDHDQQRDHAEEEYWRNHCMECDSSPCSCSDIRRSIAWTIGPDGRRFWHLVDASEKALRDTIRHGLDWGWIPGDTKTIRQALKVKP